MKKYILALILGVGLMSMQTASAATLRLESDSPVVTINPDGVSGTASGRGGFFDIVIEGNNGELVDLMISLTGAGFAFEGGLDPVGLSPGTYGVTIFGSRANFSVEIVNQVPVPAAVWLFGSALAGLFGVSRRKSAPALAAA